MSNNASTSSPDSVPVADAAESVGVPWDFAASVGLFVGIRRFEDSRYPELPRAVDDAVDLAHLFSLELGLLPAENVILALAGAPEKPESAARLQALLAAGAQQRSARQNDLYARLEDCEEILSPDGLLITAVFTQGVITQEGTWLAVSDTVAKRLDRSALGLAEWFTEIARLPARHRFTLIDHAGTLLFEQATRLHYAGIIGEAPVQSVFVLNNVDAFTPLDAEGSGRNGPLAASVLEGLRGSATADDDGLVTINTLADFVDSRIMAVGHGLVQKIEEEDLKVPLAVRTVTRDAARPLNSEAAREAARQARENREARRRDGDDTQNHRVGERWTDPFLGVTFAWIPAGSFRMGSPEDEDGRYPWETPHRVVLSRGFWMSITPITRGQFTRYSEGSGYLTEAEHQDTLRDAEGRAWNEGDMSWRALGGEEHPAVRVTWNDARAVATWLTAVTGDRIRLPTEAEWEYAARAGTETATYAGDLTYDGEASAQLEPIAWAKIAPQAQPRRGGRDDEPKPAHPVARKQPNAWGLYDMLGNVWEWVEDAAEMRPGPYTNTYSDDVIDPICEIGPRRIVRGGSWTSHARCCRAAMRDAYDPSFRYENLGFRLVRTERS